MFHWWSCGIGNIRHYHFSHVYNFNDIYTARIFENNKGTIVGSLMCLLYDTAIYDLWVYINV